MFSCGQRRTTPRRTGVGMTSIRGRRRRARLIVHHGLIRHRGSCQGGFEKRGRRRRTTPRSPGGPQKTGYSAAGRGQAGRSVRGVGRIGPTVPEVTRWAKGAIIPLCDTSMRGRRTESRPAAGCGNEGFARECGDPPQALGHTAWYDPGTQATEESEDLGNNS